MKIKQTNAGGISMDIEKMLTISTAHVSHETEEKLDKESYSDEMQLSVYKKEDYGWFIFIPDTIDDKNIPDELKKCIELAKRNDCSWLCLDCDGNIEEGLETF